MQRSKPNKKCNKQHCLESERELHRLRAENKVLKQNLEGAIKVAEEIDGETTDIHQQLINLRTEKKILQEELDASVHKEEEVEAENEELREMVFRLTITRDVLLEELNEALEMLDEADDEVQRLQVKLNKGVGSSAFVPRSRELKLKIRNLQHVDAPEPASPRLLGPGPEITVNEELLKRRQHLEQSESEDENASEWH